MLVTTDRRWRHLLTRIGIRLGCGRAAPEEVRLGRGQSWQLQGDSRRRVITCHDGRLSIVQQDDPWHYILRPGELFIISRPGPVHLTALQETRFRTTPPLVGPAFGRLFNPA